MSRAGQAEALLNDDLLQEVFRTLEQQAIDACIDAGPTDDELRRTTMQEVNALRDVQGKLKALLREETKSPARTVV